MHICSFSFSSSLHCHFHRHFHFHCHRNFHFHFHRHSHCIAEIIMISVPRYTDEPIEFAPWGDARPYDGGFRYNCMMIQVNVIIINLLFVLWWSRSFILALLSLSSYCHMMIQLINIRIIAVIAVIIILSYGDPGHQQYHHLTFLLIQLTLEDSGTPKAITTG